MPVTATTWSCTLVFNCPEVPASETGRCRQATFADSIVRRFPKMEAKSNEQTKELPRSGVRNSCGISSNDLAAPNPRSLKSQTAKIRVNTENWITTDGMKSFGYFFMFLSNTYQPRPHRGDSDLFWLFLA